MSEALEGLEAADMEATELQAQAVGAASEVGDLESTILQSKASLDEARAAVEFARQELAAHN